jgi:hypothetical protein
VESAVRGGLQGGGHNHFHKETTLRTLSRLVVAAVAVLGVLGLVTGAYATTGATPNSNLHDHDVVQVHVDAGVFHNNTIIKVIECIHGASQGDDCEGLTNVQTNRSSATDGSFDLAYTVRTLPDTDFPNPSITCDDQNPCDLYVGENFNDFSGAPKVLIPLSFAAPTVTTTTPTTLPPDVPEASKAIALPLSALALVGGGMLFSARRRRRTAGAVK